MSRIICSLSAQNPGCQRARSEIVAMRERRSKLKIVRINGVALFPRNPTPRVINNPQGSVDAYCPAFAAHRSRATETLWRDGAGDFLAHRGAGGDGPRGDAVRERRFDDVGEAGGDVAEGPAP